MPVSSFSGGLRRAGKTFHFFQLLRGARAGLLHFDFEDPFLAGVRRLLDLVSLYTGVAILIIEGFLAQPKSAKVDGLQGGEHSMES